MTSPVKIARVERLKVKKTSERADPWLIGFTDLTTLLLAFFILLFATAQPREKTWVEATKSMRTSFGGEEQATDVTGEAGEKEASLTWTSQDDDPGLELRYLHSVLKKQIAEDQILKHALLWHDGQAVIVSFPDDLVFQPGKDELSPEGLKILRRMSHLLVKLPNALEVIGYADTTMVSGDGRFGSNWHLSLARAYSVSEVLRRAGYRAPISAFGKGASADTALQSRLPEAVRHEQSRRVDLRLTIQEK